MSQTVADKIVNHFVTNYYLIPILESKLINQNVATRKNMGSSYANKLLIRYLNTISIKECNKEIYCLKLDISKYFYNINHDILMSKLSKYIKDKDILDIIKSILSETNKPYINDYINKLNNKYHLNIPLYKDNVGLSIGAMTSQFFAIYYLNDLDHFIKEKLRCKYYIRYMDDFIILDTDINRLKYYWNIIGKKLNELNLTVNPKTNIIRLSNGLNFLGYRYIIRNNRLRVRYRRSTFKRLKKKLSHLEECDMLKYYKSYASYYGYLKIVNKSVERDFKMNTKEKYDYYKDKYPKHIVFIKVGTFYKTFEDDAIIIWNLFNYTWNNGSISFGVSPSSKVLDKLALIDLSFVMVDEEEKIVTRSDEVYDLNLGLAKLNYDKYLKKEEIRDMIDNLLNKDFNKNYDKLKELLMEFN